MTDKIRVGIAGGAGYTGGELLRLLLGHSRAEIAFVHSKSQAGKPVSAAHPDLLGETDLHFTGEFPAVKEGPGLDALFLCLGHGESGRFLAENPLPASVRLVDLSQDFRDESGGFVYGLPELNRERIGQARRIANPGCFATAIQLALLPLAGAGLLRADVHVSAITGSTGAGQSLSDTTHFSWRSGNVSVYKAFTHQHLKEIRRGLTPLPAGPEPKVHFVPYRGNFTRGILAACYTTSDLSLTEAQNLYAAYYASHPFTHVSPSAVDIKQVVNTNKCLLHLEKHEDQLLITSVIDNLTKGASGQAVQNLNLLFGLDEKTGLTLKPVAF
ncbi:MAG: N-acetyl-gamma-glutamyl-phosphate reductase [Ferruginibacter sp.]|nr:N-acetyl-gamma-glutamyl-phosphate reductase [Cytophagales bacterium]